MLMTAAALMTSCYDDLELRQEIEGLGNEVEQIKTDIATNEIPHFFFFHLKS